MGIHTLNIIFIKTLLEKTYWDKNLVKKKKYTIIIKATLLKILLGKLVDKNLGKGKRVQHPFCLN